MNTPINKNEKVVVIISISSDIGIALAERYAQKNYKIIGTYHSDKLLYKLKDIPDLQLMYCDISDKKSISEFIDKFKLLDIEWDKFISCPCNPLPLKAFFRCNFDEWNDSVHVNVIEQLRLIHNLYPFRKKKKMSEVVFFAAGGTNSAVVNFSAYTASKIMLIKMCEFLDVENDDLNIFIVGPGWTKTKTHQLILSNIDKNDQRYNQTLDFMKNKEGTSMDDIFNCIEWLCEQGKEATSGRNFSVVNDKWKGELNKQLLAALKMDKDMYKLRRFRNEFL